MKFEHPSFSTLPSIIGAYLFIKYSKLNNLKYFRNKFLIWVGKISFSIYLWHYFVFSYHRILNEKFTGEPTEIPLYLFLVVIFFFSAKPIIILRHLLEKTLIIPIN